MKTREFDALMRRFELSNDEKIRPDMFPVIRIDGRNFSGLTRKTLKLNPFDKHLRNSMIFAVRDIMEKSGFKILYAYTQSDEVSILLDPYVMTFDSKVRKFNSLIPAHMSVLISKWMRTFTTFDSRLIQLPTKEHIYDYFIWRQADSETNCINAWAYYFLTKKDGLTGTQAQRVLNKKKDDFKQEILWKHGMNYNNLPNWQKRGIGLYWSIYNKDAVDKKTGKKVVAKRQRVRIEYNLSKDPSTYRTILGYILKKND